MTRAIAPPAIGISGFNSASPAAPIVGSGDDVAYFVNGTAWEIDVRQGTTAVPVVLGSGPSIKISRTESIPAATMPAGIGSNNQGNAGLWVSAIGDANNQAQVAAGMFTAITSSTQVAGGGINHDAAAVQGFGNVRNSGIGTGAGGYFEGRRDTDTGNANGVEIRVRNQTPTDGVYSTTAFSNTVGLWLTADGQTNRVSGVAIAIGAIAANLAQWDVGIGITTMGGTLSSVKTASFSDDSSAATSIRINGTHATAAVAVAAGAGAIVVGHSTLTNATALIETFDTAARDPHIAIQGSGNVDATLKIGNSTASARLFVVGVAGNQLTGTAIGDVGLRNGTANKRILLGGTTIVVSVTNGNTLGFFNTAEVAQYSTTGTAAGFTAGAGTAVNDASTFTGNTGATAYRLSDVVRALKLYGLMAA